MTDTFKTILRTHWGYEDFRGIQRQIIESVCAGHDTLGLMPTGGGKSITFQVSALALPGLAIVVTPLIALMRDQVQNLRLRGIQASAIHSGLSYEEVQQTLDNAIFGGVKLLYIAPERIESPIFLNKLRRMNISFITVDEAHCISQWGHDFRPAYLRIPQLRDEIDRIRAEKGLPPQRTPILALTATATPHVVGDIQENLRFADGRFYTMSFERPNLTYTVRDTENKNAELIRTLNAVSGSVIIYERKRERCHQLAQFINHALKNPAAATFYHAGLDAEVRNERQQRWSSGEIRIIVATNAFGMGIDKPDVRLVIHTDLPSSVEDFFQEAGRAGRDGQPAYAIIIYSHEDHLRRYGRLKSQFPSREYIVRVYENLASYYQLAVGDGQSIVRDLNIEVFSRNFHHFPAQVEAALQILQLAGYIQYDPNRSDPTRVRFLIDQRELTQQTEFTRREETLITALLRTYGGLFTDYQYISLERLAFRSGLTADEVYQMLSDLDRRRILKFIPRPSLPSITYSQCRVPSERIVISTKIYEERRKRYMDKIDEIWDYVLNTSQCRSRYLLRHFGEKTSHSCGHCDFCLGHYPLDDASATIDSVQQQILELIAEKNTLTAEDFKNLQASEELKKAALRELLDENIIGAQGDKIVKL